MRTLLLATSLWTAAAFAQLNAQNAVLDFERPSILAEDRPGGWDVGESGVRLTLDADGPRSGRYALRAARLGNTMPASAMATRPLPLEAVRGRRVQLAGWIRTDSVATGFASLIVRVDGPQPQFRNLAGGAPRGTTPWTRYELEIDVPADARNVVAGVMHSGGGTSWFDDLEIRIDGVRFDPDAAPAWQPAPADVEWLRRNSFSFSTDRAESGLADLRPLLDIVGDARIVSLGEATHGTAEFFRMKHRITELLAQERGFTIFAIEANMPESRAINEYVLYGRGDPKAALRGIYFWTWNTQEVLDMIEWMRRYNASGRGRIEFWGFDMQTPNVAMDSVRAFVARADADFLPQLDEAWQVVTTARETQRTNRAGADYRGWQDAARRVIDRLEQRRAQYRSSGHDSMSIAWAVQNANIVLQAGLNTGTARDSSMAANVKWMLDHAPAGTRAVLWAHNAHAMRQPGWMGQYLHQWYGEQQRVLGFTMHAGTYTANGPRGLQAYPSRPSGPGTIEQVFKATGAPRLILDLRRARNDNGGAWLMRPLDFRQIGALALDNGFTRHVVPDLFDALIYFETTGASVLLPRQ